MIGRAQVELAVTPIDEPITIGGRDLELSSSIRLHQLLPRGEGVILSELGQDDAGSFLTVKRNPNYWQKGFPAQLDPFQAFADDSASATAVQGGRAVARSSSRVLRRISSKA